MSRKIRTADVLRLGNQGLLDARGVELGLQIAGRTPTLQTWAQRIEWLLWGLAGALFLAGVICVVAFNWQQIGRWGRFIMAQTALLAVFGLALWLGLGRVAGQAVLTLAIGLIGPLLALFGQTYQTGADTYELFKGWALLALPWVLASRFAPAWLLWLALVETAVLFYWTAFDLWRVVLFGALPPWLGVTLFNSAALLLWELAAARWHWLAGRLGPRVIGFALLAPLTVLACLEIVQFSNNTVRGAILAWAVVLALGYWAYRRRRIELGLLSMGWLSVTTVLMVLIFRVLVAARLEVLGLLLATLILIGAGAFGRRWFSQLSAEADRQASEQGSQP